VANRGPPALSLRYDGIASTTPRRGGRCTPRNPVPEHSIGNVLQSRSQCGNDSLGSCILPAYQIIPFQCRKAHLAVICDIRQFSFERTKFPNVTVREWIPRPASHVCGPALLAGDLPSIGICRRGRTSIFKFNHQWRPSKTFLDSNAILVYRPSNRVCRIPKCSQSTLDVFPTLAGNGRTAGSTDSRVTATATGFQDSVQNKWQSSP
jgi:hypothetical protein